ncbi:translocation/assembly module TamB [Chryseotalea sanaruensis]|uniref:Translocation/assembly module TamB n=1 Tax=Chryseotalea sanaruensis TaxID=2482724 RepID=A0A401U6J0_9BACT|nr:translocation/assembly module TamB domain-containing protein [Chryseotalea sanaruensis]GCC50472.1 translocation/assembly module TamB [Chryseotalea sanaruensis]
MKDVKNVKRILFKLLRWTGGILGALLVLLVILILVIRIPAVQNNLTQRAVTFLENKISTKVQLDHIFVSFPKKIVLEGLYLEDQSGDTLFYLGKLGVDTDLWGLTQNQMTLNTIELNYSTGFIKRSAIDSTFNFDYIIQAFVGDTTPTTDKETPWKFIIGTISVSETKFTLNDKYSGNDASLKIGELELAMDDFDPDKSIYAIESFELTDTQVKVIQNKPTVSSTDEDIPVSPLPAISFEEIKLNKVKINYKNPVVGQTIYANLGTLNIEANEVDLNSQKLDIDEIALLESVISYRQDKHQDKSISIQKKDSVILFTGINIPWDIKVNELKLAGNSLQYDDFNIKPEKSAIDFNHLLVSDLRITAEDIAIKGKNISGNIDQVSFKEKSGFALDTFSTELALTDHQLDLNKFILEVGSSNIELKGSANFPSLVQYDQASVNFQLNKTSIALKDILLIAPTLLDSIPVDLPESTTLSIETDIRGSLADLTVNKFNLKTLDSTAIALKGNIKNLLHIDRAILNFELQKFYTTAEDIRIALVDSLIPTSLQLPEWIEMKGKYTGTTKASTINAAITSDVGNINAEGTLDLSTVAEYDIILKTQNLHIGKILMQPETMGTLDIQAAVKGSGFTMDVVNTTFDVAVQQFQYNQYNYKDFNLEGTLDKYLFSGTGSLHDENLDFVLSGDLDYQQEIPLYKFTFDLKNANFQKLNLSERPLKARGTLNINLSTSDFQIINGNLAIRKVAIYNGESLYTVDSLLFASIDQEGESSMNIESDIISGEFNGTFNLFSLGTVMRQHINQYFSLQDKTLTTYKTPQNFKFNLTLKNTDLITEILIPELDPFIPGKISGEFNSEENRLNIEIGIASIKYNTTAMDSLSVLISSDASALNYKFRLKNITQDTLTIDAVQLTGKIQNNVINSAFQILNSKDEKKYVLGGNIKSEQDNFRFSFLQDQVVLNYTEWTVPKDNYLDFSSVGLQAHNFAITGGEEKIALITTVRDSTVSLEFQDLQLSSLSRIIRGAMPASGKLNGNFKFTTSDKGNFKSKLRIDRLEILDQPYGDLTMTMSHTNNRYGIDLQIKNKDSNLKATGFYQSDKTTSAFDFSVALSPFNLKLIEPLSSGQLKNVEGNAEGNLHITGNFKEPIVRGKIGFQDASFNSTYLNSTFFLKNETISFEESGLAFNDFTISDDKKNKAVIDGDILTQAYKEFRFRLRLTASNFQLLNTTQEDNDLFYGKVNVNTVAQITGNANRPKLDITASLSKDSKLTYVVPQTQKSVMERKGIVQFVDKDAVLDPFLANINIEDTVASVFGGMDISANLELSDQETLHIVIDPQTGDKLSVKGNATLNFDMTSSGNMNLSGRYEITEGSYNLSFYKLMKRNFAIEKGSTIVWSGNPLNAQLDIRARFEVETTPLDLIANQINTTDQTQLNSYRQRLPFFVLLDIKGQLLAPQITFLLDMPVEKRGAFGGAIYAKITDINTRESDVNKQVFALLILKRFVSDNPLESQAGAGVSNATRTSVSRILSDQLNRLSENIKGVQLSLDIKSYEDFSTGEAQGDTQVQLGVSKSLLNDRLVVKLSGNVDVEGENTSQETVSDYIGDLALEYKLTKDGRFRVTGFRTSNYDMIDGELIETGAGLIYIKDYNTLRELFKRNAKEK